MNDLKIKQYITGMIAEGFVLAPCANPECDNLFASDTYCANCTDRRHVRCESEITFEGVSEGYYAVCPNCDEDLFSWEVV
jgi:hypothetical protein